MFSVGYISYFCILFLLFKEYISHQDDPAIYACSVCINSIEAIREIYDVSNSTQDQYSLINGCMLRLPQAFCSDVYTNATDMKVDAIEISSVKSSRDICKSLNICPAAAEQWETYVSTTVSSYDIRVAKALGSRGYDKVRISVISNESLPLLQSDPEYPYSSQFKHRWTDKYLSTGIYSTIPGEVTSISVLPDLSIDVNIPLENSPVRGIIIGDPCITSQWVQCVYINKFQPFNRITELLNAMFEHEDMDFWTILGDNFYDQDGIASAGWMSALSDSTKSHIFQTVAGNHDYWVHAAPTLWVPADQLGNGFMQFYGQDTLAASESSPYDFSQDPDLSSLLHMVLPIHENFFWYNKLGNLGYIGYSGAYDFTELQQDFIDACIWAGEADVDALLLYGHWTGPGIDDGCPADANVASVYEELLSLPECSSVSSKLRYFVGHDHCNQVVLSSRGFKVGAAGMSSADSCTGQIGFAIVDSYDDQFTMYSFMIQENNQYDNYDAILNCIKENGVSGCYDLATVWSSEAL